ncbi:MAG: carboxypeptidase-like regulatory domain-containing protein [Planctomycetota bacterium]|jgi:protocatechuate 3,4-dioxygenase beta subunit
MRSLKDIQKIVIQFNVKPRPEMRSKVLDEALEVQRSREQQGFSGAYRWRTIMKSKATKFATVGAMMAIGVLVGISFLNGASAWAKVIKAFNEVENVHIIKKMAMADGTVQQHEFWVRRPNCLYQDSYNRIVIDDGQERLTMDKENKTAQFSDSFMPYNRPEEYSMYESIKLFRGEGSEEVQLFKLDDESDESTLVFSMHCQHSAIEAEGKAWVDAETMLPRKMQVELISEPRISEPKRGEVIFNYEPIADKVFAMVIPEGFTELPRKQRDVLSGKVLDENGQPAANVIVWGTDRAGQFSEQTITDESGRFTFKLLPEGVGAPLWLPVLFRAFAESDPDRVAWSIIRDPASKDEPGGTIPCDVAYIDNDGCILRSAGGITLRMEPAGTIAGQVTDGDGSPIPEAKVSLLRCDLADKHGNAGLFGIDVHKWSGPGELGIARTDETGRYELNNLPRLWKRTKVSIRAEAEGFVSDTTSFYAKGPIEHEEVNFQLK